MLEVMERFGWTYDEYLAQPTWVLNLIATKMDVEARTGKSLK